MPAVAWLLAAMVVQLACAGNAQLYSETAPRDERGRVGSKGTPLGTLSYRYFANGLLDETVSSNLGGVNTGYTYDEANRLAYVDAAPTGLVETTGYTYNPNGSLQTASLANGITHTYAYDALNRLRTLSLTQGAATLAGYTYALNPSGHRRRITEATGRTADYTYDGLYRLTNETIAGDPAGANGTVAYGLDKVGNRESRSSSVPSVSSAVNSFNSRDWLSGDTNDANGNTLTSAQPSTLISQPEIYDFEDRLIIRRRSDGSTVNLAYDADGVRIQKTILSISATLVSAVGYLVDTNNPTGYAQVVEEHTGGQLVRTYTYGTDLISQTSYGASGGITTRYYLYDGLGSVRALASASGAITDTYTYDAFGNLTSRTGTTENAYLYRGEQFDADLGLYYLRARFYNQNSGRFWNQDTYEGSSGDPASLHKYLYANGDGVNGSDPSGHETIPGLAAINTTLGNILRIAIPAVQRLGTTALYNIYRGVEIGEKTLAIAEYVGVAVGVVGLVAEGADSIAQNLLNNTAPIADGPYPEQFKRGTTIDRIGGGNLSGNVNLIDDLDSNGIGTSLRSHNLSGGEEAYLKAIQDDAREVSRAPNEQIYGTTKDGRYVSYRPGTVKGTALVVAIPENDVRITLSPSFRNALRQYRATYRTVIQVVPVRNWRR